MVNVSTESISSSNVGGGGLRPHFTLSPGKWAGLSPDSVWLLLWWLKSQKYQSDLHWGGGAINDMVTSQHFRQWWEMDLSSDLNISLCSVKMTFWLLLWSKYKNWTLICLYLKHPLPPAPPQPWLWGQYDCFGLIFYSGDHKMICGEEWELRVFVCGAEVGFVSFK